MKRKQGLVLLLLCFLLTGLNTKLPAQNSYPSSGNALINELTIGKLGRSLSGDSDPYNIYSPDNTGAHDLILFGNSSATLHLRLHDGHLKMGNTSIPNAIIYNDGSASFGGNVGIGIENPATALAVNGTTTTKEIIVTEQSSDWPDYVFSDAGYQIPDLTELELFIQTHKHLPGIPTSDEVKRDGQNLGAIQARLLEKIEELTLYIIEQQKRIEALEKKLQGVQQLNH